MTLDASRSHDRGKGPARATHTIPVGQGQVLGSLNGGGINFTLNQLDLQEVGTFTNGVMRETFHLQVTLAGTPVGPKNVGGCVRWSRLHEPVTAGRSM